MKFSQLSTYFEKLDKTSSRLTITELLAQLFKDLSVEEIDKTLYLLQGRVGPLYEKKDFGMAEKMVTKSIILALNIEDGLFKARYKEIGDLGETAEKFKKKIASFEKKDLEILEVYNELLRLTQIKGIGSQETKISLFSHLVRQLDSLSCRYLVRIPINNLRLGFSDMTILDAFSWLVKGDKSLRPIIEKAYHVRPDLGYIGKLVKAKNFSKLESIKPVLFTPILMMRAERLSSSKEIIEKLNQCIVEPKFDGFRLQVHYKKLKSPTHDKVSVVKQNSDVKTKIEVKLYSRNLEDVTFMYPDIVKGVLKEVRADEIIFEGEAIGFDPLSGNFFIFFRKQFRENGSMELKKKSRKYH